MTTAPRSPDQGGPTGGGDAPGPAGLRDALAVSDLFQSVFRRDLAAFYPTARVGPGRPWDAGPAPRDDPRFRLDVDPSGLVHVGLFGVRYEIVDRSGRPFSTHDHAMIRAIGSVLSFRFLQMFRANHTARLELYRGGTEDHYVAAFIEPDSYAPESDRPSRIAGTIHALRTAALSTFENRRVSTGVILLGPGPSPPHPSDAEALTYGVELTGLKSIHRLCDGRRTLFLVDPAGRLAEVVDVARWADALGADARTEIPCARDYAAHARATAAGGHVCVVLSPNQEIKLFAGGTQQFAYAHGRWRILDAGAKFASWASAVADPPLCRILFQAALDLVENRQGGLFVIVDDPGASLGRLVAPADLVDPGPGGPPDDEPCEGEPDGTPGLPPAKRSLHYLVRGRSIADLPPAVLENLAGLDGAVVMDRSGRILAFGAILRHDASASLVAPAEGARTTAAMVASRFGPVLKISEDGIVSCYLGGAKVWHL